MELAEKIEVTRVRNVFMRKGPRSSQIGDICIFGHHLIFAPHVAGSEKQAAEEFWLLHKLVDRVLYELIARDNPSRGALLALKCKNFLGIIFEVPESSECRAAARTIEKLANLDGSANDYPFFYNCPFAVLDDGWNSFNKEQQFSRLMMDTDMFRISSVNKGFKFCTTYPEKLIVPKGIGDDYLKISATFRDGGRFPTLKYFHSESKTAILSCGQPLIGPTNRRCREDEEILNSVLKLNRGFIVDTRAKNIASSAKSKGGGYEPQENYRRWRYINCPIPRIKEIRDSLVRMVEACSDRKISSDKWISRLSSSGWLATVSQAIECAANVAQCVCCDKEIAVVVHGGEGIDTTIIATSLAQIILDSDARTIRGFESVIENDWICGGHPFATRNRHIAYTDSSNSNNQESPVFFLFLDCVHQLLTQYPESFEFDEKFLIFLFEHAYASEFGSFLTNNEKEKQTLAVKQKTVSLWSYIHHPDNLKNFVFPYYRPNSSVIWPSITPQSIKVWDRVFFRWQKCWKENDVISSSCEVWKKKEKELQSKVIFLQQFIRNSYVDTYMPKTARVFVHSVSIVDTLTPFLNLTHDVFSDMTEDFH